MKNRFLTASLAAVLSAVCLCGCTVNGKQVFFSGIPVAGSVFRIGKLTCSEKTARVYIANYYNIYGMAGQINLWDEDLNTDRLEENIRKVCLDRLTKVYALNVYAKDHDIELTQQEKEQASKAAGKYMNTLSGADRKYLNVSEEDIKGMYETEELASIVYDQIVSKADDEVSDDEARVMDAVVITFTSGQKDKAEEALKELKAGNDIQVVAKKYSTEKKTSVTIDRNSWSSAVVKTAFELGDGEFSDAVTDGDSIYIIYCVSKYDEDRSEENRKKIIQERKEKVLDRIISAQNKEDYSSFDPDLWNSLTGSVDEKVTTDSFFECMPDIRN